MTNEGGKPTASLGAAVKVLTLAVCLSGAGLAVCDGLLPQLATDFGTTTGEAGAVTLAFTGAYGAALLAFGPLSDRLGKLPIVCVSLAVCAAAAALSACASSFEGLVLMRLLWGAAAAGLMPMSIAWVGDAFPYEHRQAALARLLLGFLGGMLLGQIAGGQFGEQPGGWRGAFLVLAPGYGLVALFLASRMKRMHSLSTSTTAVRLGVPSRWMTVLRVPWARVVLLCALAEGILLLGPVSYMPSVLHARFALSPSVASGLIALFTVGGLAYALTAALMVKRISEARMVLAGGALMTLGMLGWYVSPYPWSAAPLALVAGFGTYLFHGVLQTHATQMTPAVRGTAVSLFASSLFVGHAIGVAWSGAALDRLGPAVVLVLPAACLFFTAVAFGKSIKARATTGAHRSDAFVNT